jgi:hypothetical protein
VSSQHEENPLAVTAVPSLDPVLLDESSSVPTAAGLFKVPGTSGQETLNHLAALPYAPPLEAPVPQGP